MTDNYDAIRTKEKLATIMVLLKLISSDLTQIDATEMRRAVSKTKYLVNKLNNEHDIINLTKLEHYNNAVRLLDEMIGIQKSMIDVAIKRIDPTPPGFASKISNKAYNTIKSNIGSDDAGILWGILKVVSKPLSYVMNIFETINPDRWRVASNWERVKLVAGLTLTLIGVASIVAAIVLSLANPVGLAVVGGVGLTVVFGSVYLGLAAALCVGVGAVLLDKTGSTLSKKLDQKQELKKMRDECEAFVVKPREVNGPKPDNSQLVPKKRKRLHFWPFFTKPRKEAPLKDVGLEIESLKNQLKNKLDI